MVPADDDDKIVAFRKSSEPSARLKGLDWNDKRTFCRHGAVQVWDKEPILECCDCGAVVDPYQWIRDRCHEWAGMVASVQYRIDAAKLEMVELKKALKVLRKAHGAAVEAGRAQQALMVLPPQRSRV